MLNSRGVLKCVKDVIMEDGKIAFTEGNEYRYWRATDRHKSYNDQKQSHIIYKEAEGDVDNFISDHFEVLS